jgi:LmbE family N-acetylglucosaminyl deacetylase
MDDLPAPRTVLVVSPHPDDETLSCGGALALHRQRGHRVVVVQVTDGSGSRIQGLTATEMAARRAQEAREAARQLDVELELLCQPEYRWRLEDGRARLSAILEAVDPDLIYAPSPIDYHPEHLRASLALTGALARTAVPRVRIVELQVPLTARLVNVVIPVGSTQRCRSEAEAAYKTQVGATAVFRRRRRYNRAFWGEDVECFWELTADQYRAVVAAADWSERSSPYRSFRSRAWSDPLAYVRGWTERGRLARIAARL